MNTTKPMMETREYRPFHFNGPSRATMELRQPSAKMRVEWAPRKRTSPRISKAIAAPPESHGATIMAASAERDGGTGIRPTSGQAPVAHTEQYRSRPQRS